MQKRESRNESLEKWRIEKGKPPRSDKPWIPVGKTKINPSANSSFQIRKNPSEAAKPKLREVAKPIHTNFLKRRSGMCKWSHFGYSEDIKRRRVSSQLGDKENTDLDPASVNSVHTAEDLPVKPLSETPSVVGKEVADKITFIKTTRRDLLNEWKKAKVASKSASEDLNSSHERRKTLSTCPMNSSTSQASLRRQTMTILKKPAVQFPINKLPAKEPAEFKKTVLAIKRRQTMVIQNKSVANVPKIGVAGSSQGELKVAQIPRSRSQPVLKQQKTKEAQPCHVIRSSLHKTGEPKKEEKKTAANARINATTVKKRMSLNPLSSKALKTNQSGDMAPTTSKSLTASKGAVQNGRSTRAVLRDQTSATALALQSRSTHKTTFQAKPSNKTVIFKTMPSNKSVALHEKRIDKIVSLQAKPSNATVTNRTKRPQSKILLQKNAESRANTKLLAKFPPKPMPNPDSKVDWKMPNVRRSQFRFPLDNVDSRDQPAAKSLRKSNLGILKPASKTPSNRKSVAFEIPVHSSRSCKSPSLRRRLSSWLELQGRTPSTFRHLHCFGVELSEVKRMRSRSLGTSSNLSSRETPKNSACLDLDDQSAHCTTWLAGRTPLRVIKHGDKSLNSTQQANFSLNNLPEESSAAKSEDEMKDFEEALANLSILIENSYSLQEATEWLDAMFEKTQNVCQLAAYWECRAKISELGSDPAEALALLTQGINCNAQPVDKLLDMQARISKSTGRETLREIATPRQQRQTDLAMSAENIFSSTLIKYIVKDQTSISRKLWADLRGDSESIVTVTPVRRTHRRSSYSMALTPASASKLSTVHCVTSLDDIPKELKRRMVLVSNPSLNMLLESPLNANSHLMF